MEKDLNVYAIARNSFMSGVSYASSDVPAPFDDPAGRFLASQDFEIKVDYRLDGLLIINGVEIKTDNSVTGILEAALSHLGYKVI